jgi:hypothetical protein
LIVFALLLMAVAPASSQGVTWTGTASNLWSVNSNWTSDPTGAAVQINGGSNMPVLMNVTDNVSTLYTSMGASDVTSMTIAPGAKLTSSGLFAPAVGGTSVITQTGGEVSSGGFSLADSVGATGTYSINGGTLASNSGGYIGTRGLGTLNISNTGYVAFASWSPGGFLALGGLPGQGSAGTSAINQTGGTLMVSSQLDHFMLGGAAAATGVYNLDGGLLQLEADITNGDGTGFLRINGGRLFFRDATSIDVDHLEIGTKSGTKGQFSLAAGKTILADVLSLGSATSSGNLSVIGGTATVNDLVFGGMTSGVRLDLNQALDVRQSNYSLAEANADIAAGRVTGYLNGTVAQASTVNIGGVAYTRLLGTGTPSSSTPNWTLSKPMVFYWPGPVGLSDAALQQAVDGGYNLVWSRDGYGHDTVAEVQKASTYGLRTFVRYNDTLLSYDRDTLDNPAKLAELNFMIHELKSWAPGTDDYVYHLGDEPSAADFPYIARMVAHLRQRDPDHLAYVNLLPNSVSSSSLGASNYASYLSQYINTVRPSILSYDHYQFLKTGDTRRYLENLGIIATAAKNAGIPFVNVVQNSAFFDHWRVPNANELRFLTTTTLAYGAQGIGYFLYQTNTPNSGGLVNADGTTTAVYANLTPLNREFENVATQLRSLDWVGTYLRGYRSDAMPPGTTQLPTTSIPFNFTLANNMTYFDMAPLKGVLVGFFDTEAGSSLGDATFAYVVNLDYSMSKTYTFTGPGELSVFDAASNLWTAMGSQQVTLNLAPGGGKLIGLTSLLTGDFSGDGNVDAADYVLWRKTNGSTTGYDRWRSNYDGSLGSGMLSSNVPEPSCWLLIATAVAMPIRRLQRPRRFARKSLKFGQIG